MDNTSDSLSFENLFLAYHSRFVLYANSYVKDIDIAKDLATDAFMSFWEKRAELPPDCNVPGYILTTLRNKCLNHLNRQKIELEALAHMQEHVIWELNLRISTLEASAPEKLFAADIQRLIDETLNELPERTRVIFGLCRMQDKSHKEVANMMDISVKGVEFHMAKALTILRKRLKDYIIILLFLFSMSA